MIMTKYRTVNNGYYDILQYKKITNILWFKFEKWEYVWKPYFSESIGRGLFDEDSSEVNISSFNTDIEKFIYKWVDIDMYFEYAKIEQKRLEKCAYNKKHKIKELN